MIIGIDASRAVISHKTGTENYAFSLIKAIAKIDPHSEYRLYFNSKNEVGLVNQENFKEVPIYSPKLWTQYRLSKEMFLNKIDILFVPAHTLPVLRPRNLKTVVTIHDLGAQYLKEYHQFPHRLYLNKTTEYAIGNATEIITVSHSTEKEMIEDYKGDPGKITVIYEGYDREVYHFDRIKNATDENQNVLTRYKIDKPYLLFVGTIQPRKNIKRLIKAFSKIDNNELILVLAGKKGWMFEDIIQLPSKLGISDRVRFLDYVKGEDLPYLYYQAQVFVFPSLCEGFGIPLLEAMALGCPVVTANLSSMPEVVGEAGYLVDPYSVESIKKGIEEVINNKKRRKEMQKAGQIRAEEFSWEKAASETLKVFEKIKAKINQR